MVGARLANIGMNSDQGAAYVFTRTGGVWTQQQKLTAADGVAQDFFGEAVALDGDTTVIGAPLNDFNPMTDVNTNEGAAYVFKRTAGVWSLEQKLIAADAGPDDDNFGSAVDIDADTCIVGEPREDTVPQTDNGAAYVFVRSGMTWTQQAKLQTAVPGDGTELGKAVAVSGNTAAVGAPFDEPNGFAPEAGLVYVFTRSGTMWSLQQIVSASDAGADDNFGMAVALDGEFLVVGAPFDDVAMADDEQGSAYVYERVGGVWGGEDKLTGDDSAAGDEFGTGVGISGSSVIGGAPRHNLPSNTDAGAAYVFVAQGVGADLELVKTDSSDPVAPASSLTYTLTVTNNGPEDATGVVVTDTLPAGATYVSDTCGAGPPVMGVITWNIGNLINGASAMCQITVTVPAAGGCNTIISNTAAVTANENDSNAANNSDTEDTTIVNSPLIACPSDIVVGTDAGLCSASVAFNVTASGNPAPTIECKVGMMTITSPHAFPLGMTTVNCTATNGCAPDAACSFTVTVNDNEAPTITCPPTQFAAPGVVNYPAPLANDNCPGVGVVCVPASGSVFPAGVTTVTCTATDAASNQAQCSFTVQTFDLCLQHDSNASVVLLINSVTGDYLFCCAGQTVSGKGTISKKGTTYTLTHNTATHRVQASVTVGGLNKGTASLQMPVGTVKCSITDRNISDNTCACSP